jgi:hypothetical protein
MRCEIYFISEYEYANAYKHKANLSTSKSGKWLNKVDLNIWEKSIAITYTEKNTYILN